MSTYHAVDNLSHLAQSETEPFEPDMYDYDEYAIMHYSLKDRTWRGVCAYDTGHVPGAWNMARRRFLQMYNDDKLPVRLIGRVFK